MLRKVRSNEDNDNHQKEKDGQARGTHVVMLLS